MIFIYHLGLEAYLKIMLYFEGILESISKILYIFFQGCGHKFCANCWQMHFEIQINQVRAVQGDRDYHHP